MARSLIGGMITNGWPADLIHVSDPQPDQRESLNAAFPGIHTHAENEAAVAAAEIIVLAVKPQRLAEVCKSLASSIQSEKQLIISIAAGIRSTDIDRWLGGGLAIVRCMPNTPALVQSGATGLYATAEVSEEQHNLAESILRSVGIILWVEDEALIDAVTAVSGSGPAYIFLVIEAMEEAGVKLGLKRESARLLSLETTLGAAKLALESEDDTAALRHKVTSKGGTTEQALKVLEEGGLRTLFADALRAAAQRANELADQLGAQ